MGKKRGRPVKRTSKKPTHAQLKAKLEATIKEENELLDEEPTNIDAAEQDEVEVLKTTLNNLLKIANRITTSLGRKLVLEMERLEISIEALTDALEMECKPNVKLENINK